MQLTKDEIRGLAKIAAGDWADVSEWMRATIPHELDRVYSNTLNCNMWKFGNMRDDSDTYILTEAGWEALLAYNESASADVSAADFLSKQPRHSWTISSSSSVTSFAAILANRWKLLREYNEQSERADDVSDRVGDPSGEAR